MMDNGNCWGPEPVYVTCSCGDKHDSAEPDFPESCPTCGENWKDI